MERFPELNLPPCELRISPSEKGAVVFDIIRKKQIVLTPEEWVRQHMIHYLINHRDYPKGLIRVESQHHYFKNIKRSDILVLNPDQTAFLLVECKAPGIKIDQKALAQSSQYNKSIQASYLGISNGLQHHFWHFRKSHYEVIKSIPIYQR